MQNRALFHGCFHLPREMAFNSHSGSRTFLVTPVAVRLNRCMIMYGIPGIPVGGYMCLTQNYIKGNKMILMIYASSKRKQYKL